MNRAGLRRVSRDTALRCTRVTVKHYATLTDPELLSLNTVAAGWATNDQVTLMEMRAALAIVVRYEAKDPSL